MRFTEVELERSFHKNCSFYGQSGKLLSDLFLSSGRRRLDDPCDLHRTLRMGIESGSWTSRHKNIIQRVEGGLEDASIAVFHRIAEDEGALYSDTANSRFSLSSANVNTHHHQDQIVSNIFQGIPTQMNFHDTFMYGWNSGNSIRGYENFCRIWRQRHGRDQFYRQETLTMPNARESKEKIFALLKEKGYQFMYSGTVYTWVMLFDKEQDMPLAYGELEFNENVVLARFEGELKECEDILKDIVTLLPTNGVKVTQLLSINERGQNTKTEYLFEEKADLAKPYYYPWLADIGMTLEEIWEGFDKSSSNVILLIGPPGGGKSTFLRSMTLYMKRKHTFFCHDQEVILNPGFNPWVGGLPNGSFLAVEDADGLIREREQGNNKMSAVLNSTSGILPSTSKIAISTNLKTLKDVDEAIIRPGRNYRVLFFRKLTAQEATIIREKDGLPPYEFSKDHTYSLADVLNAESMDEETRKKVGIGFLNR